MHELTGENLKTALIEKKLISEADLHKALGDKFDSGSAPEIEFLLINANAVSEQRMRTLKGQLWNIGTLPSQLSPVAFIPRAVAESAHAIALGGDEPAVAFVEPSQQNQQMVIQALGGANFRTYVTTVLHWRALFDAAYSNAETMFAPLESIEDVLNEAVRRGASDFHIVAKEPPALRVDGSLVRMECAPLSAATLEEWFSEIAGDKRWAYFKKNNDADQAISFDKYRVRLNYGRNRHGPTLAGRLIPTAIPTPAQLNMPPVVTDLLELERGLILVTGPTGSGKSTTLAALLNELAMTKPLHLITLEDPIEYFLTGNRALVAQREKGEAFGEFSGALRQALRQDPDVILVGELRDRETMEAALTAAETGHLVFGTLHTYDAVSTVNRYVNAFPADEQEQIRNQLAYLVEAIISQTLVPRRDGGRVAAMEIMLKTPATAQNMRKPDGLTQLRATLETSSRDGMQTIEMALAKLVKAQIISRESALYKARRKGELANLLGS